MKNTINERLSAFSLALSHSGIVNVWLCCHYETRGHIEQLRSDQSCGLSRPHKQWQLLGEPETSLPDDGSLDTLSCPAAITASPSVHVHSLKKDASAWGGDLRDGRFRSRPVHFKSRHGSRSTVTPHTSGFLWGRSVADCVIRKGGPECVGSEWLLVKVVTRRVATGSWWSRATPVLWHSRRPLCHRPVVPHARVSNWK